MDVSGKSEPDAQILGTLTVMRSLFAAALLVGAACTTSGEVLGEVPGAPLADGGEVGEGGTSEGEVGSWDGDEGANTEGGEGMEQLCEDWCELERTCGQAVPACFDKCMFQSEGFPSRAPNVGTLTRNSCSA